MIGIHPSIWAGLYKREYLISKDIKCLEAKGAGYIDNHFRTQVLCQTNKIAFLNKPFNYYRLSNEDASTVHYDLSAFIARWASVHKLFDEKFPEKWDALAPYCVKEEWINTYSKDFFQPVHLIGMGNLFWNMQKNILSTIGYLNLIRCSKANL